MSFRAWSLLLLSTLAGACSEQRVNLGGNYRIAASVPPIVNPNIDVLFVVDSSNSIADNLEQVAVHAQQALFAIIESAVGKAPNLHVGITTTDMGAGRNETDPCMALGNGGVLVGHSECEGTTAAYLADVDDGNGGRTANFTGTLADNFACLIRAVGDQGCGFEQPFAAAAAAVSGVNPGFLREDALLATVFITDEDDCSADDSFFALPPKDSFACSEHGWVCDQPLAEVGEKTNCRAKENEAFWSPRQLLDALTLAKGGDANKVLVAGISGPNEPIEVRFGGPASDVRFSVSPACTEPSGGKVFPAVRLRETLGLHQGRSWSESLCSPVEDSLRAIGHGIGDVAGRRQCLQGALRDMDEAEAGVQASCRVLLGKGLWSEDSETTELTACDDVASTGCFRLTPSAECGHNPSSLKVDLVGVEVGDQHVTVACLAP